MLPAAGFACTCPALRSPPVSGLGHGSGADLWDAGSLQLVLSFPPSLSPHSPTHTAACKPLEDAPNPMHSLYHELEERLVIMSQKFLIVGAEDLKRRKGRVSSAVLMFSSAASTPSVPQGHSDSVETPEDSFAVGCTRCASVMLCWKQ